MFALRGAVEFGSDVDPAAALGRVAGALRNVSARELEVRGGAVTFRGGIFRPVMRHNVLNAFSSGTVTVGQGQALYELHIDQLPVIALCMLVVIAFTDAPIWAPLLVPLFIFIGVPIDVARFRRLVRNAANNVSS